MNVFGWLWIMWGAFTTEYGCQDFEVLDGHWWRLKWVAFGCFDVFQWNVDEEIDLPKEIGGGRFNKVEQLQEKYRKFFLV
jgi:hypothetical protein